MTAVLPVPLGGPAPTEIQLANGPLTGVVVQARFSSVLKIDSKEGVAPFQEELRGQYPLLEQVSAQQFQIDFGQASPGLRPNISNVWRFSDANREAVLSLTTDAITLEIQKYPGRAAFLAQWYPILALVERLYSPTLALRLGVRYVNRVQDDSLDRLTDIVNPSLVGVADPLLRAHVIQAMSEAVMKVEEGDLILRWGILPPNAVIDPGMMKPVPNPSWILDIDVSSSQQQHFSKHVLEEKFESLAARAYAIFRYVMTDTALKHFGA